MTTYAEKTDRMTSTAATRPAAPPAATTTGPTATAAPVPSAEPVGLGLTSAQVAGSALAAVTGAFLAARLGVAGTLAGVAIGSIVGTIGSATYTYSLQRGHALVLARPEQRREGGGRTRAQVPWQRLGLATVMVALLGLGALTLVESVAGKPVSSVAGGSATSGTTLGQALGSGGSASDDTRDDSDDEPQPTDPAGSGTENPAEVPEETPTEEPTTDPTDPSGGVTTDPVEPTPTPEPTAEPTPVVPAPVSP